MFNTWHRLILVKLRPIGHFNLGIAQSEKNILRRHKLKGGWSLIFISSFTMKFPQNNIRLRYMKTFCVLSAASNIMVDKPMFYFNHTIHHESNFFLVKKRDLILTLPLQAVVELQRFYGP